MTPKLKLVGSGLLTVLASLVVGLSIYNLAFGYVTTIATTSTDLEVSNIQCPNGGFCTVVTVPISYLANNRQIESTFNKTFENSFGESAAEDYIIFYQSQAHLLKIIYWKADPNQWAYKVQEIPVPFGLSVCGLIVGLPAILFGVSQLVIFSKFFQPVNEAESEPIVKPRRRRRHFNEKYLNYLPGNHYRSTEYI